MRPLTGLRVLLTRPAEQAATWAAVFEAAGAAAIVYPTIEIAPPPSCAQLDQAIARLASYDWLVLTSAAAARFVCSRLPASLDPASLARPRVAAVGPESARPLRERGFAIAILPEDHRQEGLIDALAGLPPGTRVLFPQAVGGREDLGAALAARGCIVDVVPASQTLARGDLPAPPPFDVAVFASPSALRAFVQARGRGPLERAQVAVVGPTTSAAAAQLGLKALVAAQPTPEALVRVIADACARATTGAS